MPASDVHGLHGRRGLSGVLESRTPTTSDRSRRDRSARSRPLSCAGVTTYKAVKAARRRELRTSSRSGIGGLGHLGLQYARIAGGFTVRSTSMMPSSTWRRSWARLTSNHAARQNVVEEMLRLGGADAIVSTAATPEPLAQRSRPSGRPRLVLVGLPEENAFRLPFFETVLRGIQVIGSLVGTRRGLVEVFELHASGRTRVVLERRVLEDVNDASRRSWRAPCRPVWSSTPLNG